MVRRVSRPDARVAGRSAPTSCPRSQRVRGVTIGSRRAKAQLLASMAHRGPRTVRFRGIAAHAHGASGWGRATTESVRCRHQGRQRSPGRGCRPRESPDRDGGTTVRGCSPLPGPPPVWPRHRGPWPTTKCSGTTTRLVMSLQQGHRDAFMGQQSRRCETGDAAADYENPGIHHRVMLTTGSWRCDAGRALD